jgi:hypothetical protein
VSLNNFYSIGVRRPHRGTNSGFCWGAFLGICPGTLSPICRTKAMERIVVSPSKIFQSVVLFGLSCLFLAVALSILSAFIQMPMAQQIISLLSDGFKLCLGAVLALMGERKLSNRR